MEISLQKMMYLAVMYLEKDSLVIKFKWNKLMLSQHWAVNYRGNQHQDQMDINKNVHTCMYAR